jgi:uncharacterized protein (UPF0371 family)
MSQRAGVSVPQKNVVRVLPTGLSQVLPDETFGTPTYTKTGTPATVFQVPGTGVKLGAVLAVDL